MKHYFLSLLYISSTLYAMEQGHSEERCLLAELPIFIQDHIVSYLELSTSKYETDDQFIKRLSTAKNMIKNQEITLQLNQQPNESCALYVNSKNKLIVSKITFQPNAWTDTIVRFKPDQGVFQNIYNYCAGNTTDTINACALSSDKSKVVAWTHDNNLSVVDLEQNNKTIFCSTFFLDNRDSKKEQPQIDRLAVSNNGKSIAFSNAQGIHYIHRDKVTIIPNETDDEMFGRDDDCWQACYINAMDFNAQKTMLGIQHASFDLKEFQTYLNASTSNINPLTCVPHFWITKNKVRKEYATENQNYDDSIKLIKLKKEESPLTLAKYFALKAVCKNLHKQSNFFS